MARIIRLIGDVNEVMHTHLSECLEELEKQPTQKVTIELNSDGGNILDAFAIAARIRSSSCIVDVHVYGRAYSAAVLILAAGDTRKMSKYSFLYFHEAIGRYKGSNSNFQVHAEQLNREEQTFNAAMEEYTGLGADLWDDLAVNETFIDSKTALKLNFIHGII